MQKASGIIFMLIATTVMILLSPVTISAQKVNPDTTKAVDDENEDSGMKSNAKMNFSGTVTRDVVYSNKLNFQGAQQQLAMDIYKPPGSEGKKYPLVVLIHGGSWKTGTKKPLGSVCMVLAENGYVAASIDYRLGWGGTRKSCSGDTVQLKQALYRAMQDTHAALHYLADHANEYSIDKDSIFIGGASAGAVTALFTAYAPQKEADVFFPGLAKELGDLEEGDQNPKSAYKLRGIISMWGAYADPSLITSSNALPTIFFQGEKDKAVPFNSGPIMPCPEASQVYGTYPLYNRLKELGVTTVAHVDPKGGHGVFTPGFRTANILCFLKNVREGNKKQIYLTGEQSSCN